MFIKLFLNLLMKNVKHYHYVWFSLLKLLKFRRNSVIY